MYPSKLIIINFWSSKNGKILFPLPKSVESSLSKLLDWHVINGPSIRNEWVNEWILLSHLPVEEKILGWWSDRLWRWRGRENRQIGQIFGLLGGENDGFEVSKAHRGHETP